MQSKTVQQPDDVELLSTEIESVHPQSSNTVADEDINWIQYHLLNTLGSNAFDWAGPCVCNWFSPDYKNDAKNGFSTGKEEFDQFIHDDKLHGSELKVFSVGEVSSARKGAREEEEAENA